MTKIGIVIPYYGKFPNYFDLFLKSCEKNPTIDWLIFSDIAEEHPYPDNVHRIQMTFEELKNLFQSKFDFEIALDSPYKLCDYKVMTGYLFSDYLTGYDYWGYSDIDMLFGDIRKFLPDEIITQYDKVGHLGHLTLYHNTKEINTLFMKTIYGRERYKEVLSSNDHFSFTEWFQININDIFVNEGKTIWFCNDFFDVEAYEENFRRVTLQVEYDHLADRKWVIEKQATFASWEDGRVYQWRREHGEWVKKEYMYVHFQKRNMEVCIAPETTDRFLCVPNQFVPYADEIPTEYVRRSKKMGLLNKKHWNQWMKTTKYTIIEKTGPIRHMFRRKK